MARPKECWRIKEDADWAAKLCHGIGTDARRNDAHVNKWITTPLLRGHQYCAALQMCTNTYPVCEPILKVERGCDAPTESLSQLSGQWCKGCEL